MHEIIQNMYQLLTEVVEDRHSNYEIELYLEEIKEKLETMRIL